MYIYMFIYSKSLLAVKGYQFWLLTLYVSELYTATQVAA